MRGDVVIDMRSVGEVRADVERGVGKCRGR